MTVIYTDFRDLLNFGLTIVDLESAVKDATDKWRENMKTSAIINRYNYTSQQLKETETDIFFNNNIEMIGYTESIFAVEMIQYVQFISRIFFLWGNN